MEKSRLRPSSRTAEAHWIADQLAPFGSSMAAIVPNGFDAYVRLLHPAIGTNDEPMRWDDVAAKSRRTMHRLAQFEAINRAWLTVADSPANEPPRDGNLVPHSLKALCATLAGHTRTPQSCFFCLWERVRMVAGYRPEWQSRLGSNWDILERQSCPSDTRIKSLNSYAQQ